VGVGAVLALVFRALFSAFPAATWLSALLPWRTVVMGLLTLVWSQIIIVQLGPGPNVEAITVGLSVLLLALLASGVMLIEYWHPSPIVVRLLGATRTLITGAVVLAVGAGLVGRSGLGVAMMQGLVRFDLDMTWAAIGLTVGLLLVVDLVLGVPQALAAFVTASRKAVADSR
jgi:hypothetical protein